MAGSRSKKFFINTLTTALLQIVTFIVGFIVPRLMLSYYGSEINGLVTSISQFIGYFNIVEAGLSAAAVYALYKPLADKDNDKISSVVSASRKFYLQAGYIFVSLTIGLAVIYPFYIQTDFLSPLYVGFLVMVLGSGGFLGFFIMSKYGVLLSADQKGYVSALASIIQIVANTAIIVLLAPLKMNIVFLKLTALSSIFIRSFIIWLYCKIKYKDINYYAKPDLKALDRRGDALYQQILGAIQQGTTVFLLTLIVKDLSLISIVAVIGIAAGGLSNLLSVFISGLAASFGEVMAKNESNVLQKSAKEFEFAYYFLISFVYSVALVLIMPFVMLYTKDVTDVNYNMPIIAALLLINGYAYNMKTPQGMLIISAGMYKETRIQISTQAAIILVGGAILAFPFGIYGILAASIAANIYRTIDLFIFVPKHITKLKKRGTIVNLLINFSVIPIIVFLGSFIPMRLRHLTSIPLLGQSGTMMLIDTTPLVVSWSQWVAYASLFSMLAFTLLLSVALIFRFKQTKAVFMRITTIFSFKRKNKKQKKEDI